VSSRRIPRAFVVGLALAGLSLATPAASRAQDADLIRGKITGPDSLPIQNVNVSVSAISNGVTKTAKTDRNGVFTVAFPNAEGDYWVTLAAIGYQTRRFQVKRLADEDVLIGDARLAKSNAVQQLNAMQTVGRRPTVGRSDGGTDITGFDRALSLSSLDVNMMGDLSALASMVPGATYIPGVDGGPGGFSVFGLDPDQNSFMLNGMAIGPDGVPRDAGLNSSLNMSPYDATRGGFSGGQVNSRLGSGGNLIRRTMSFTGLRPGMQWSDRTTEALGNEATNGSVSGSSAGPIRLNSLFYNFSFQADRTTRDLRTMLNTDPFGLNAAGLSADSVTRLKSALLGFGIPVTVDRFPTRNGNESGTMLGKIDWTPSFATGQTIALTMQGNVRKTAPSGLNLYETPAHSGRANSFSGSLGLQHNTYVRTSFYSVTNFSVGVANSESSPYLTLPSANVRITSTLDDGTSTTRSTQVGGNSQLGTSRRTTDMQLSHSLTWLSMSGKHSLRMATNARRQDERNDQSSNLLGSFSFNSLADFEADRPASFSRLLTPRIQSRSQGSLGWAINDSWRPNADFQMTMGGRIDASRFGSKPEYNPAVEQAFGIRNDHTPNPIAFSPRVGFSKLLGTAQQITAFEGAARVPRQRIAGGIGVFQGLPSPGLLNQVVTNTGLPSAVQTLNCTGIAVPTPDWDLYLADPSMVPDQCADGTAGTVFASTVPSVTLINPKYNGTTRISSDLSWSGATFNNRFNTNVQLSYAVALNNQNTVDINFDPTTRFSLASEGDRPVFVEPTSITATTGQIAPRSARLHPEFNRVNEIRSNLRRDSRTMSVRISPMTSLTSFRWNLAYTYQWNRQQVPGFQSTVGNPQDIAWSLNDLNSMHAFQLGLNYNLKNWVTLSSSFSVRSGNPITPRVAGDINGDGAFSNDRPFIFDPADPTIDPALAAAMQTLLDDGSPIARDCLGAQLGRFAGLGSCRGPWTLAANSVNMTFNAMKLRLPQRASIQLTLSNPLGGLDMLVHGSENIHGWGRPAQPDQTLLYVRGFDAENKRFRYDVNQRFGSTRPQQSIGRFSPVTLQALVRLDVGPPQEQQLLIQALNRGRRDNGVMMTEAQIKSQYITGGIVNPMTTMLRQADLLKLTVPQADTISYMNRWFTLRLDSLWTPVAKHFAALPTDYNESEVLSIYKTARRASFDLMLKIAPTIQEMLTGEQKRLLPPQVASYLDERFLERVRTSTAGQGGGGAGPMALGGASGMTTTIIR
jgi:hypothetical protein